MQKDLVWSAYYEDPVRFADVINGLNAAGKLLVEAKDFFEKDTKSIPPKMDESGGKKHDYAWKGAMQRDVVRKYMKGVYYFIIGLENQEFIDYEIPLRMMKYEVAEYEKQYRSIRAKLKNKKNLKNGEYMYKFRKKDKLVPIVTLILYGGAEKWDGPKRLQDMFDLEKIPKVFRLLLSDYKINVIELREIEDTCVFKTDFKHVVDVIKASNNKRKLGELIESDPAFRALEPETYDAIATYIKERELRRIKKNCMVGGKVNMCKAFRELIEDGRIEGREEGRAKGRAEGIVLGFVKSGFVFRIPEHEIVDKLVEEYGMDEAEARMLCEQEKSKLE